MQVKEIMKSPVITLSVNETVAEAIVKFAENHISGAPVLDAKGQLVGVFTEADVLKALRTRYKELKMVYPTLPIMGISFIELTKQKELSEALKEISHMSVEKLMTRHVVSVAPTDAVEDVIPMFVKEKINRIPVVKDGKVVGIITRGDIIEGLYKQRNR